MPTTKKKQSLPLLFAFIGALMKPLAIKPRGDFLQACAPLNFIQKCLKAAAKLKQISILGKSSW